MSEQLWICDHAEGCQAKWVWCNKPFRDDGFKVTHINESKCDMHSFGNVVFTKAIPYPKETPMQYELIKPVSIAALEQAGACERELHRFAFLLLKRRLKNDPNPRMDYGGQIGDKAVIDIASQCQGGIKWLLEKGFIREKVEPLKVGDKVRVCDGSWSYFIKDSKLTPTFESGWRIGHGIDSPMEIVAICENLPTPFGRYSASVDDKNEIGNNNLILKGQSGNIYFTRKAFVKRIQPSSTCTSDGKGE